MSGEEDVRNLLRKKAILLTFEMGFHSREGNNKLRNYTYDTYSVTITCAVINQTFQPLKAVPPTNVYHYHEPGGKISGDSNTSTQPVCSKDVLCYFKNSLC